MPASHSTRRCVDYSELEEHVTDSLLSRHSNRLVSHPARRTACCAACCQCPSGPEVHWCCLPLTLSGAAAQELLGRAESQPSSHSRITAEQCMGRMHFSCHVSCCDVTRTAQPRLAGCRYTAVCVTSHRALHEAPCWGHAVATCGGGWYVRCMHSAMCGRCAVCLPRGCNRLSQRTLVSTAASRPPLHRCRGLPTVFSAPVVLHSAPSTQCPSSGAAQGPLRPGWQEVPASSSLFEPHGSCILCSAVAAESITTFVIALQGLQRARAQQKPLSCNAV
eukprot:jgi/Ulvmu1/1649/UM114_0017.1